MAPQHSPAADRYLDLLTGCLTRELFLDEEARNIDLNIWVDEAGGDLDTLREVLRTNDWRIVHRGGDAAIREVGHDWPPTAETMVGRARLDNARALATQALVDDVPGDFIETGVWRGGVTILFRAVLEAYGDTDRSVWVADSFEGLPAPNADLYPADEGVDLSAIDALKVGVEAVKANFARYGLLDDRVQFLPGWFSDTLPEAPIEQLAVLRLDGDLYESTMDAITALEPKVSPGGYVIVDDYGAFEPCRKAVDDYRKAQGISDPITTVDWTGVWWQKSS